MSLETEAVKLSTEAQGEVAALRHLAASTEAAVLAWPNKHPYTFAAACAGLAAVAGFLVGHFVL